MGVVANLLQYRDREVRPECRAITMVSYFERGSITSAKSFSISIQLELFAKPEIYTRNQNYRWSCWSLKRHNGHRWAHKRTLRSSIACR
jgi:hypothetical protein